MRRKRIVLIGTGGTISSGGTAGSAVPRFSANDLLEYAESRGLSLPEGTVVETVEFSRVLSANMTPIRMYELACLIRDAIGSRDVDGAVVTHGTGTIEETSFLVDLYHSSQKPVVFTGSMRPLTTSDADGPRNVRDAIAVASDEGACEKGVLLVMNCLIFAARDATKSHSNALDTFQAEFGPLGAIGPGDEPSFFRTPARRQIFPYHPPEPNVDLIRFHTGMDGRFIRASIQAGARGIVMEGSGMGNVNEAVAVALKDAIQQGLVVLLASRSPRGTAYPFYDTVGAGADLARAGAFFSSYLSGLKARLLLCAALGFTQDRQQLSNILSGGVIS